MSLLLPLLPPKFFFSPSAPWYLQTSKWPTQWGIRLKNIVLEALYGLRSPLHIDKNGTIWHFFRALFPIIAVSRCSVHQDLNPGHTQTHFRAFPTSIRERSPPKCLCVRGKRETAKSSQFCPPTCTSSFWPPPIPWSIFLPKVAFL